MRRRLLLAAPALLAGISLLAGDPAAAGPGKAVDWAALREKALDLAGADKGMREAVERVFPEGKPPRPEFVSLSNASFYTRREADAAEIVSWFLDHEDAKVRLKAAAFLAGNWRWRSAVFPLAELLKDPSPQIRGEAAFGLAHLFQRYHNGRVAQGPIDFWTREKDRPELQWLFAEPEPLPERPRDPPPPPPERRVAGMEELVGRLGADRMEDRDEAERKILEVAATSPEQVAAALSREHEDPEIAMRAQGLLPKVYVQFVRRRALDAAKDPKLREDVEKAFADQGAMQRFISGRDGNLRPDAFAAPAEILGILLEHPDPWVVARTLERIQAAGFRELAPQVRSIARREGPFRVPAMGVLAELRDRDSRAEMERLLSDPDPAARRMAVKALGDLGDPAAAPRLAQRLSDSDPQVSQEAAEALWTLWSRAWLVPRLAPLLEDPSPNVMTAVCGLFAAMEPELRREGQPSLARLKQWWKEHQGDPDFRPPGAPGR